MKKNIFKLITILSIVFIPLFTNASFIGTSPTVVSTSTCSTGLSCGLVGYWTFDGKDMVNGVALDKSGNNNRVNLINMATSTFFAPGKLGQGFNFDGVDDYVTKTNFNYGGSTSANEGTASFWVRLKTRNDSNFGGFLSSVNLAPNFYQSSGTLNCRVDNTLSAGTVIVSDSIPLNKWTHYVCVWNTTGGYLYEDGNLVSSDLTVVTPYKTIQSDSIYIGSDRALSNRYTNADFDDVRIYNRALSASEITQLYSSGANTKQGSSQTVTATSTCSLGLSCGLVGYWTFDGKDVVNGVALDKSGNGNTGRLSNIATSTFFSSGKLGQGFNFDGSNDTVNAGSATVIDNMSAVTISMWVKLNTYGASGGGYLINKGDTSSGGHGWSMYVTQANGLVTFTARYNTTSLLSQSASNTFAPSDIGKWVHLIVTWDGTTNSATGVHIYKNGTEVSYSSQVNGSASYLSDASNDLNIGDGGLISNRQTNGIIDDVHLYNRVLSSKEISQLYSSGANTKQVSSQVVTATSTCSLGLSCGLVGYWTFDGKDVANGVVLDKSGNNNRVNLVNIATSTFYAPGKLGQGFNFDFSNDAANLSTNILSGRSSFSIMMWARKNKSATGALFASRSGGPYWRVTSVGGDTLLWIEKSDCSTGLNRSSALLTDDKFHHVGITMDTSGNINIYKDGVSVDSTNFAGWDSVCTDANDWGSIGNYAASFPFGGVIDDVRIYGRTLSATEVKQLYNMGK